MKNSFELDTENIIYCPNSDNPAGLRTRMFYIKEKNIKINIPYGNNFLSNITITKENIELLDGNWSVIDVLIDENELRQNLIGGNQRKKIKSELDFFIPNVKLGLGLVSAHSNTPLVFAVTDNSDQVWIFGNNMNRAFIYSADVTTGRSYEDNSGLSLKLACNCAALIYSGQLDTIELSGAFSRGFSGGFKS